MSNSKNKLGCFGPILITAFSGLLIYGIYNVFDQIIIFISASFVLVGYNSLFFLDNLFKITPFNPIIMWGIFGLLFGSIAGVISTVKKNRLSTLLILYPTSLVIVTIIIMSFVNKPKQFSGAYIPTENTNSTSDTTPNQKYYYELNTDANVRSGPSTKYSKILTLKKGAIVEVLSKGYYNSNIEWFQVVFNEHKGFVSSKLLNPK